MGVLNIRGTRKVVVIIKAWLHFFPMYIMLIIYATCGFTGFILSADHVRHLFPPWAYAAYYIVTYGVIFPLIFVAQYIYYKLMSKRYGMHWKGFRKFDKASILFCAILGIALYQFVERIFGVETDQLLLHIELGDVFILFGDVLFFAITAPILITGFYVIQNTMKGNEHRRQQAYLVVVGTTILGTITQDWFWWITAPNPPWGPGVTIYYKFSGWLSIGNLHTPIIYIIVASLSLFILYLSTLGKYKLVDFLKWCVLPYLLLVLIGNILFAV